MKPWKCSICGKRCATQLGVIDHGLVVHKRMAEAIQVPKRQSDDDGEESYADRAVQAAIDEACGIYNPNADWLLP